MGNGITNSQPVVPFSTESSFSKNGSAFPTSCQRCQQLTLKGSYKRRIEFGSLVDMTSDGLLSGLTCPSKRGILRCPQERQRRETWGRVKMPEI